MLQLKEDTLDDLSHCTMTMDICSLAMPHLPHSSSFNGDGSVLATAMCLAAHSRESRLDLDFSVIERQNISPYILNRNTTLHSLQWALSSP